MSERIAPTRTPEFEARLKKRYASERRFRALGLGAIVFSVAVLVFLLGTMILSIAQVAEGDGKGGGREPGPKPGIKGERKRGGPVREDFVASYDRNKDGKISFEEFRTARKTAALEEEGRRQRAGANDGALLDKLRALAGRLEVGSRRPPAGRPAPDF